MEATPLQQELHLHNLRVIKVLGNGAMGTVFLVHNLISDPSAHSPFALKVVHKSSFHSDRRARWEISVLNTLNYKPHPFLPFLIGSFETQQLLAWAIPFCPGRDLNVLRHRQADHAFSPAAIRFYLAEIVCALQHLHSMGIVYRDLKPENILIQQSGHVTLTDFDLSRTLTPKSFQPEEPKKHNRNLSRFFPTVVSDQKRAGITKTKSARVTPLTRRKTSFADGERSNSFVGTEEYLSPEMVRGDGHEFAVDWWAVGILAYEMLYGTTPFRGKNRNDTFGRILMMEPKFTGKPTPLTDLIGKLLEKEPTRRLGYRSGACEIKEHPFFLGLQWKLLTQVVRTPFIPSKENVELTTKTSGINIEEYLEKLRETPSPLDSPSCTISLTEF